MKSLHAFKFFFICCFSLTFFQISLTSCGGKKGSDDTPAPAASEQNVDGEGNESGEEKSEKNADAKDKSPSSTKSNTPEPETGTKEQPSDSSSSDESEAFAEENMTPEAPLPGSFTPTLHMGFDGTNDYSILISLKSGQTLSVADPAAAKLEKTSFRPTAQFIDTLLDESLKPYTDRAVMEIPDFNIDEFKAGESQYIYGRYSNVWKLTPLKAGDTKITFKLGVNSDTLNLSVIGYKPEDKAAGEARYNSIADGNARACTSCHGTGQNGAPLHALGRVVDWTEEQLLTWVKTGKFGIEKGKTLYEASISHTWTLANEAEEKGIASYLRSIVAKDPESLIRDDYKGYVNMLLRDLDQMGADGADGANGAGD